ncbi:hypothetical protein SAMN05443637_105275 [Pseudonocardia thermophila]|uniref:Uncharacterized protein n=1 Tax=Pseudonocardia thermophila TaxID=1848 RepID=A0A1M6S1U8_PSETH|nr:hypothetical protein [Pseudonocardia thermophila]SHK38685.1 hypothetical protein SAMN05443637_105275 [Pseudonocardia thermophila]
MLQQVVEAIDYHRQANSRAHRTHQKMLRLLESEGAAAFWDRHVHDSSRKLLAHDIAISSVIDMFN